MLERRLCGQPCKVGAGASSTRWRSQTIPPSRVSQPISRSALSGSGSFAVCAVIVDDALRAGQALDRQVNKSAELVDQAMLEKGAVDSAAALKQEPLHAKNSSELRHRSREILAPRTRENIGGAILAEFSQISVRDLLPQHRDDVIAGDIVLALVEAAEGSDGDDKVPAVPMAEVRLARWR